MDDPTALTKNDDNRCLVQTVRAPLLVLNADLRVQIANQPFCDLFQVNRDDVEGQFLPDLGNGQWNVPSLRELLEQVLTENSHFENFDVEHDVPLIGPRTMRLNGCRFQPQAQGDNAILLSIEDVTEPDRDDDLRRSEASIRDAKQYAENLVDTVRHSLLVLDADLRVQTANRTFYRIFQVSPEETENCLIYYLGNGQWNIPELRSLLNEILPDKMSFDDFEVEHNFPGIGQRYMWLNARRIKRTGNQSDLILLAIEDVTQQRQAEREKQETEIRFTSLVRNIKDHSIFTLDLSGHITSWNIEAERILGYSEREAVGQPFDIVFTPEDVERGIPQRELQTAREAGRAEDERWHRRKNGKLFWALGIITPTTDADGNHTGYSKILRDITERKREHGALQRNSAQLRALWDSTAGLLSAPDAPTMMQDMFSRVRRHIDVDAFFSFVVDEDEDGEYLKPLSCGGIPDEAVRQIERLEFGQAICGTVARHHEPIVATHIQESDDPLTELVRSYGFRAYACNPLIYEDQLIGTHSFASRSIDEFTEYELAFFRTLTRYATIACARLQLLADLQESDRRKDEFLAMLAHELRNPLAPLRSGLDILRLHVDDHQETIELMQEQVEHVVRLVDDLLDVSRIMRGRIVLRTKPVEITALVRRSAAVVRPLIDSKQQELRVSLPDEPVWVNGDPVRLLQIIENLLTNASKYTNEGGHVELRAERQESQAVISVTDTGVGIDPELLPKVFDLFTQSSRSLDRSQGGLGIGLTLVRRLVDLHGGTVSARSKGPGLGSTFVVRLPVTEAPAEEAEAVEQPIVARDRRILVVEDNAGLAWMVCNLLMELGHHEIETVHDGRSALAAIRVFHPEIVLLDIGLPGMDGYEVARKIRENPDFDDVLLVALTGYGQEDDTRLAMEAGFDEHLLKPTSVSQMKTILAHPKLAQ